MEYLNYNIYRLPVAYFLLGKSSLTKEFLHNQLKKIGDREDIAAQNYKKFVAIFLEKLRNV
jgi:hypothetical protein